MKKEIIDNSVKLYVVAHKDFEMPIDNDMYCPILVGRAHGLDIRNSVRDDEGDNIAHKNSRYNELTALYWIWKNSQEEIIGICHYRRYFVLPLGKVNNIIFHRTSKLIDASDIYRLLRNNDVILHNKTLLLEGNRRQLTRPDVEKIDSNSSKLPKQIISIMNSCFAEMYPKDIYCYEKVMTSKTAHLLNMMICRREVLDEYCSWLFPLLDRIDDEINMKYPGKNERCIGLIAERLLDVWVMSRKLKIKECYSINTERIDWKFW